VASHRRPKQAGRARVTVLTATAAAAVALSSQAANADTKPTVKSVKAQVDTLYNEAEQATQKYDGAQEKQSTLQKQVDDLQNEVAREQGDLNKLRDQLGSLATAQYRSGGLDESMQLLLSSNPDDYLAKASTLDQVSSQQAQALKQIADQQRTLDQQKAEAASKLAELDATRTDLGTQKKQVQAKLASAQKLLNTLTAAQKASITQAQTTAANRSTTRVDLGSGTAADSRAAAALAEAETRIGKPYVYGATGPDEFDCSGLTSWAYAQAGVSIPRTSEEQANAGTHLTESELKPGDLVIFFSDAHHVGLYVGNGMVLHAPKPGAYVRYEAMSDMPFEFGVRI